MPSLNPKHMRKRLKRRLRKAGLLKRELMPKQANLPKKKNRSTKRKRWNGDKNAIAAALNANLPDSEKWFWREWESAGMKHNDDKPNEVFLGFIPDVVNRTYGYVIEVDGSIHERDRVKSWDERKNKALTKHGMIVLRLEAYNYEQFGFLVDAVSRIRSQRHMA